MKDIPRRRGRAYIASLIAEGEHARQDFKFAISDARKIARSISAFANAEGGRLLIGVKDNGVAAGVRNEEDVYVVEQAARRYCSPAVDVEFTAFTVDTNVVVIRASIPKSAERPVRCEDSDGRWRAYYRVADENIVAHPLMVRAWMMDAPLNFSLTPEISRLLEFLDSRAGGVDVADISRELSVSVRSAEQMVTALAAMGIIGFEYHAPAFRIVRVCPADDDSSGN